MTRRWDGLAAAAVFALSACQPSSSPPEVNRPTEAEARQVLARYVEHAKVATDAKSYCAISPFAELCEHSFDRWGGTKAIPDSPPNVLSVRNGGKDTTVLIVCGSTGEGKPYRTDFAVHYEAMNDSLQAQVPVFWSGTTWSGEKPGSGILTLPPTPRQQGC